MFNEKFWLAIAFFTFFGAVIKFVWPMISKALEGKSKSIAEEILAAKEMKERAAKLLEKAEKYHAESMKYADKLVKDAEDEAQKFTAESKRIVEEELNKKTAAAVARIKLEEESTIRQIKAKIVSSAIQSLTDNLSKDMSKKDHDHLIAQATQDFAKIIH